MEMKPDQGLDLMTKGSLDNKAGAIDTLARYWPALVMTYEAKPTPESLFSSILQGITAGQFVQDPETASIRQNALIEAE